MDLSGIKTKMGDFAIDELAALVDKQAITGDAVEHYRTHLQGRPRLRFALQSNTANTLPSSSALPDFAPPASMAQ